MKSLSRSAKTAGQFLLLAFILTSLRLPAQDKTAEAAWKKSNAQAESALKKNQINQARELYASAVTSAEKLNANDARLTETLRHFGSVSLQLGETPDAERAFRRALALDEKRLGTNDLHLAEELLDLGEVCMDMNRFEEADEYFVRAQAMVEKRFGRYDRVVGICLQGRGDAALQDDRLADAEKFLKEALELAESPRVRVNFQINQYATRAIQRPNKGQVASVLNDFGVLYKKMKKYDKSEDSLKRSLGLFETQYGRNSLFLCNPLVNYAETFVEEKKYRDAETMLRRCVAILKTAKSDHPLTDSAQRFLDAVVALEKKGAATPPAR